jgi:dTDP-4-dehydrorhamnose reductase
VSRLPVAVITGAHGQLGAALTDGLSGGYQVVALSRRDLDVTDHRAVIDRIVSAAPKVVVNATAYNNVDGAEDAAFTAFDVNAMAVRSLARAAEAAGAVLVHYSTDFVFDGKTDRPYNEDDPPSPASVYGQSKLVGEWMAASVSSHYVLRVESLFGGTHARSTIDAFIDALLSGREVRAFYDRQVSPSFVEDVVMATRRLLDTEAAFGTYHCVNSGYDSWYGVAEEAARLLAITDPKLLRVSVNDQRRRALRPQFAALDNAKLSRVGIRMPEWREALARHIGRQTYGPEVKSEASSP